MLRPPEPGSSAPAQIARSRGMSSSADRQLCAARRRGREWHAGTHAELVAFGVDHRDPPWILALADVDSAGPECFETLRLALDVVDSKIEVDAYLADLGFGNALQHERWMFAHRREQYE